MPVETPELDLTRQFYFIWHRQKYQTAAMREFLELCHTIVKHTMHVARNDTARYDELLAKIAAI